MPSIQIECMAESKIEARRYYKLFGTKYSLGVVLEHARSSLAAAVAAAPPPSARPRGRRQVVVDAAAAASSHIQG